MITLYKLDKSVCAKHVAAMHEMKLSYKEKVKKLVLSKQTLDRNSVFKSHPQRVKSVCWHHQTKRSISLELRESKCNFCDVHVA